jgi:hypothetical protein
MFRNLLNSSRITWNKTYLLNLEFTGDTWLLKPRFNLCTTYVLPLVGLNKFSFSAVNDNFVNSYVSEDNNHVIVQHKTKLPAVVIENTRYEFGFEKDGYYYGVFEIPEKFVPDVQLWREGKYSKLSDDCKWILRKKSGLRYYRPYSTGGAEVAYELLVLDKDQELRALMEKYLDCKIDPSAELGSIPGEDNFYTLDLSTKLGGE